MKMAKYYCMRFYVTYRCNSRCYYCNVWQEERFFNTKELTLKEGKSLIRQCYEAGIRYIDFTGGEPALNENLAEMIRYASSLGIKTEVTVNGLSACRERLLEVAESVNKFNISLDTLKPDVYKKVRGVDGPDRTLETLEEVLKVRTPKIMTVISKENIGELDGLIRFAQEKKTEIYLNPVFSYFGEAAESRENYLELLLARIYEPYTVVMLHFMEFIKNADLREGPPCSANNRTLTFAPDGGLILPCYHAMKETIPWTGDLAKMLESETFHRYAAMEKAGRCMGCRVIPYFGISFNYRLDKYFLLQSYSEKLNHLKRDFLNRIPELKFNVENLKKHLRELLCIVRSLDTNGREKGEWLYQAERTEQGYLTDIYKEPLTIEQYEKEKRADDCWQLELAPHYFFDKIYNDVFQKAFNQYQTGTFVENALDIFKDAAEFQLRWWKWYTCSKMKVSVTGRVEEEEVWIKGYLDRLEVWRAKEENKI